MHAPPCDKRRGDNSPCHADIWLGFGNIMPSFVFCGVEHGLLSAGHFLSRVELCGHMHFCVWLFSQDCNCTDCAAIGSVYWAVPWLAPTKMGLIITWSGCCMLNPIHPWSWLRVLQPWVPNLSYAPAMIDWYSHHVTMQTKRGNSHCEKETLERWELPGGNTWGTREIEVIIVMHTPFGVTSWLFGL